MAHIVTGRKSGLVLRSGSMRRKMLWIGDTANSNTIALGTAVLLRQLNAAALALRPFTIVRTHGYLSLRSDQAAGSEAQSINYGETVVTEQASAIGVTAVPTPVTDDGSDWHVFATLMSVFILSDATGFSSPGDRTLVFDSKAMRKVDLGEDLVSVVETNATGTSEGVIFRPYARTLIKLH